MESGPVACPTPKENALGPRRISISGLMFLVILVALAFAAFRNPTELWAGSLFALTLGMLLLAPVGVAYRGGDKRLFWVGFAVFGYGYLALILATRALVPPPLPTTMLIDYMFRRIQPDQTTTTDASVMIMTGPIIFNSLSNVSGALPFFQIGHSLATLLVASLGAVLVGVFAKRDGPLVPPRNTP
jgi:hypothetical protein